MTPGLQPGPSNAPYGCAVTAHLLAVDEEGRWLILRTTSNHGRWQLPGGRVHAGESPAQAATREAREETGLVLPAQRFLAAAWVPASAPGGRDRIAFVFGTRTLRAHELAAITLQAAEVDQWQVWPAGLASAHLHPLVAERLAAACLHGPGRYIEQIPSRSVT